MQTLVRMRSGEAAKGSSTVSAIQTFHSSSSSLLGMLSRLAYIGGAVEVRPGVLSGGVTAAWVTASVGVAAEVVAGLRGVAGITQCCCGILPVCVQLMG